MFGGKGTPTQGTDESPFFGKLMMLHIERMKWETPKVSGKPPSPRGGATSVLAGHRLFIYGGECEPEAPPSDELWVLDLELLAWTNTPIRGVSPGRLAYAAAAAVGNKCFFFGGWTGDEVLGTMHTFDAVTHMWEPVEENQAGPSPPARYGHSLVAVKDKIIMYGGRDAYKHYATLAIFDATTEVRLPPRLCLANAARDRGQ